LTVGKNEKKLNILVVYAGKFGFHVVSYFLSKYASKKHNVTYLGLTLDQTGESLSYPSVNVKEHTCQPGLKGRKAMLSLLRDEVSNGDYDVVFTQYLAGISWLKHQLPNQKIIVDIRSGYLLASPLKRYLLNTLLCKESKYLTPNVTINSKLLGHFLGFKDTELTELPLGAEPVDTHNRNFEKLKLIYVGTLSKRNIHLSIEGLNKHISETSDHVIESYDIIGSGSPDDEQLIKDLIDKYELQSIVTLHGYVPREKTGALLEKANIGVSFVPITPYYDLQPVTKTFEFLLAGLPLIATATTQNQQLISEDNGVLIQDTGLSFCEGLKKISCLRKNYNSKTIQEQSLKHSWERVINEQYLPYIEKVSSV
jgi:glycosyltransferase involved in cell wall biosynthesis